MSEIKTQSVKNLLLAGQHLLSSVSVVSNVAELFNLRSIDFLVLGSDEHAGHADELEAVALDVDQGEEAVQVSGREEEGL